MSQPEGKENFFESNCKCIYQKVTFAPGGRALKKTV